MSSRPNRPNQHLLVLFDNSAVDTGLKYGWGFSCLVRTPAKTVLFDTGADAGVLRANMATLGVDPREIDSVVLSHDHWDHTGGLRAVLQRHPDLDLHLTPTFSEKLVGRARKAGARVVPHGPLARWKIKADEIAPRIYTTGMLEGPPDEHALIIDSNRGLVVITGCSHPGIDRILEQSQTRFAKQILLALGGFHLLHDSPSQIKATIARLQELRVRRVAPCHCTGSLAKRMFQAAFGTGFLRVGVGSEIDLSDL